MATVPSQNSILQNITDSLLPMQNLITGAAYIIGIVFVIKAVIMMKTMAESRMGGSQKPTEPLMYFLAGAMLIFFPTGFEIFMNTLFGYSSVLAYAPPSTHNPFLSSLFSSGNLLGNTLALFVQTIGLVAFVRGWIILARGATPGQQSGGVGKAVTHIVGGVLAMNIIGTLQVINNTIYGS